MAGKVAIVTGGYSGIGLEVSRVLAKAGAQVIVPARSLDKAKVAMEAVPEAELGELDLADPDSIDAFAHQFEESDRPLHILVNAQGSWLYLNSTIAEDMNCSLPPIIWGTFN
ncbi:SDR family NAD(P)-dependent oxidoreductase [Brevibacillus brevis]|uniref:SDR family NAD(P)-dependent oxidoreductase n=1 Tax=Brevibacillus brevis TaxID=1393 RepID=UPI001EE2DEA8|nr:SDR family NAD(P)-dependent oxidoreductase [Brevibacillus brevis]